MRELRADLFEDGRLDIRETARFHIRDGYFSKSLRCRDCVVTDRCDGAHINLLRDQGLKLLSPLVEGPWAENARAQLHAHLPQPEKRLATGRYHEPAAPSLPGYAQPEKRCGRPSGGHCAKWRNAVRNEGRKSAARLLNRGIPNGEPRVFAADAELLSALSVLLQSTNGCRPYRRRIAAGDRCLGRPWIRWHHLDGW